MPRHDAVASSFARSLGVLVDSGGFETDGPIRVLLLGSSVTCTAFLFSHMLFWPVCLCVVRAVLCRRLCCCAVVCTCTTYGEGTMRSVIWAVLLCFRPGWSFQVQYVAMSSWALQTKIKIRSYIRGQDTCFRTARRCEQQASTLGL